MPLISRFNVFNLCELGVARRFLLGAGLALAVTVGIASLALAADPLSDMEQRLFFHAYTDESAAQRLDRLESSIFGARQTGSDADRTARLSQAMENAAKAIPDAEPAKNTDSESNSANPSEVSSQSVPRRTSDATDYPAVTALEQQVFGRDFIHDDVSVRLDRLEKKAFGQAHSNLALADRVDKLQARYPLAKPAGSRSSAPEVVNVSPALQNLPDDPSQFFGQSRDIYTKIDALERNRFNGKTYPNELMTERLDRLEQRALGTTYSGESVDSRVSRLLGAYQTHSSRAVSGGYGTQARPGYQSRQPYQAAPDGPSAVGTGVAPRQNIQIGGGFSSNSSSAYNFSPEMMSMLPPGIRSQMGGQSGANSTGTVVMAPSTVVIERQSFGTPGFQTYGGKSIQYYNYYGSPGTEVQSQSTTTVIQPNGSQSVYSYPGNNAVSGNANGLPAPAYVGYPGFLQALNQLEINVFGQANTVEPVPIRLGKLESAVMSQMYVGYPDEQRLQNLQKAYQLQAVAKLLGKSKAANAGRTAGSLFLGVPLNGSNPMNPSMNPMMNPTMPVNPGLLSH